MLAALVKALGIVAVNCGDMVTEGMNLAICIPVFDALEEIINLCAG